MKLLVAIVNYRTPDLTAACLESLEPEVRTLPGTRVVVVDNASDDLSVERIAEAIARRRMGSWAELRALERNGGFSYGNNAVIGPALALPADERPEYVLLLNPDTLVRRGALHALVDFMDAHRDVGIAGSRLEDPDGTQQHSRFRFHSISSEFESGLRWGLVTKLLRSSVVAPPLVNTAHPIDWVAGASMIVRREVFDSVGLMDERYFLYFEEVDFCLRARRAGWPCWYVPESRVVHLVGQASGVTHPDSARKRRPRYWFESRRRYFVKNHGRAYALAADLAWSAAFGLWRLRRRLQSKPDPDPPHLLTDFVRFSWSAGGKLDAAHESTGKRLRGAA